MMDSAEFWSDDQPIRSASFTAKYTGWCEHVGCHKGNVVEQGDCCEYYRGKLMHLRCARAQERAETGVA